MNAYNKTTYTILVMVLLCQMAWAQNTAVQIPDLIGTWEIQGTLMGDDGSGWLMPHKHASETCKDHSVFLENNKGKEVKYDESCEASGQDFSWSLEDGSLTLTRGERSITWHILSLEDNTMKVGVQLQPDSERRMYVVYKKLE